MLRRFCGFGVLLVCAGCANGNAGVVAAGFGGEDGGGADATAPTQALDGDASVDSAASSLPDAASEPTNGGDSSAPMQPCVHNSDCIAGVTNLCVGNNGVACLGGFCVNTGKPMVCNDGVPCVSGTCDANTNNCVYTPNDSACQTGTYCDLTKGCVAQLACAPGDSVCDRLDLSACKGLWSCANDNDAGSYCVQAPPPCSNVPNAVTLCDGEPLDAGAGGVGDAGGVACSWECESGYVSPTWNGTTWVQATTLTPPAPLAGCACEITNPVDVPAYTGANSGFVDTNCDGIVGTIADAIFVSPSGSDGNPGTIAQPKHTLTAAIAAAKSAGKDVYADKGTYNESITLASGVSLYGGYDSANQWSRAIGNVSLIQGTTNVAVTVNGATAATTLQFFTITALAGAAGTGQSSTGVQVLGSAGPILVQGCTINPGAGGSGVPPVPAIAGAPGGTTTSQSGGTSSCNAGGGPGGGAVSGTTGGNSGTSGSGSAGGAAGGGGNNGSGCCCITGCSSGTTGNNGSPGGSGGNGADSTTFALTVGTLSSTGAYTPASGVAGAAGSAGSGGGGAGSGGASASGCTVLGQPVGNDGTCHNNTSGWGGGGGAGGCGGGAGGAGGGGGGSFGVVVVGSSVTVDLCPINAGAGGSAAGGGAGASGGTAGTGASGGSAGEYSGTGGNGGNGGTGGNGGNGSGGTGGPSFCVYYSGSAPPTYTANTCTRAGGGAAGAGGGGLSPAGYHGLDAEVQGS